MDLSASVRMGLAKKKMNQEELAKSLGKRRETVSSWCNGYSIPSNSCQNDMANIFCVSVSEFIKWGES